jgi:predicted MPP superfamily phosphohydrolase
MGEGVPGEDVREEGEEDAGLIMRHRALIALLAVILAGIGLVGWMFLQARAMPVVRATDIVMAYPPDVPRRPIRIALLTDTHLSPPDSTRERLDRIVDLVNAQKADIILLGGDYVGDGKGFGEYPLPAITAPFGRLRAPLGVIAVPGNHDIFYYDQQPYDFLREGFARIDLPLLINRAVRRGPLTIGGIDDPMRGRPDIAGTVAQMRRLGGLPIVLTHSPDNFPALTAATPLTLTGHTHCGQIALPWFGAIYVPAATGRRYACGRYDEAGKTLIVSAGVGTSGLPFRLAAPPDIWVVTIRPKG